MKILAVETSGKTFSVALNCDGKTVASFIYDCGHIHSDMIVPSIERILKDTGNAYENIDKFAVCAGPGSFTGIRVGMTAVKTLAQALGKPIATSDSLTVLEKSLPSVKDLKFVSAIDALRNEVYVKNKKGEVFVGSVENFIEENKKYKNKIVVVGSAACVYAGRLAEGLGKTSVMFPESFNVPKASVLAFMAQSMPGKDYRDIEPLYVRRSWAEESKS
jgi:tRNA threonylcarbamoyladenosine biosynthesis protein TsaB